MKDMHDCQTISRMFDDLKKLCKDPAKEIQRQQ